MKSMDFDPGGFLRALSSWAQGRHIGDRVTAFVGNFASRWPMIKADYVHAPPHYLAEYGSTDMRVDGRGGHLRRSLFAGCEPDRAGKSRSRVPADGDFQRAVRRDVSSVVSDLRQMSTGDSLQAYLTTGQQADLERAVNRAVFFSRENADYDQIRFLGETARRNIAVNRNGAITGRPIAEQGRPALFPESVGAESG